MRKSSTNANKKVSLKLKLINLFQAIYIYIFSGVVTGECRLNSSNCDLSPTLLQVTAINLSTTLAWFLIVSKVRWMINMLHVWFYLSLSTTFFNQIARHNKPHFGITYCRIVYQFMLVYLTLSSHVNSQSNFCRPSRNWLPLRACFSFRATFFPSLRIVESLIVCKVWDKRQFIYQAKLGPLPLVYWISRNDDKWPNWTRIATGDVYCALAIR